MVSCLTVQQIPTYPFLLLHDLVSSPSLLHMRSVCCCCFLPDSSAISFALKMTLYVLNMAYKTLDYLTPKTFLSHLTPCSPLLSLSVSYTYFLYHSGYFKLSQQTAPKCQPLKSTKAHWLLTLWVQKVSAMAAGALIRIRKHGRLPAGSWHTLFCSHSIGRSQLRVHASLPRSRETPSQPVPRKTRWISTGAFPCCFPSHALEHAWPLFLEHLFLHLGGKLPFILQILTKLWNSFLTVSDILIIAPPETHLCIKSVTLQFDLCSSH